MSYILDALKKAERERATVRVPTLRTVHGAPPRRRARWPLYVAAVVVAANVALGVTLLRRPRAPVPDTIVASAVSSARPEPVAPEPARSEPARPGPAPRVTSPPSARPEAATARVAAPSATAAAPSAVPAPRVAETMSLGRTADPQPTLQASAGPSPGTIAPGPVTPEARPSAPTGTPSDTSRTRVSGPPADQRAPRYRVDPPASGGAPLVPAPPAVTSGPVPFSPLAEMPAAFQAAVPKLRVQVLVFDSSEAGAWVLINNRKYVAGDRLGDDITLERITEDGAVLGFEGRRYLLKQ